MSAENVERLRRLYGEWAKGNLWALREIADPDIAWEWSEALASFSGGPRIYRGLEEIGAATLEWLAAWDEYWMTAEEFIHAGDEIVVVMTLHARAANTDHVFERSAAAGWELRDGRAIRVRFYDDAREALEAARPSQEPNLALVRRAYEAFNRWGADPRGEPLSSQDVESLLHPDITFETYANSPEAGVYRGRDAVIAYNQRLFEQFESVRIEVEELVPAGNRVLVISRQHAVPRAGAAAMVVPVVETWAIRDGLLAERRTFPTRSEGLEAVGLPEQPA
jgi:ketosteroid isomerase-like protein